MRVEGRPSARTPHPLYSGMEGFMDEQVFQRLAREFAGHDDIQALITAARNRA